MDLTVRQALAVWADLEDARQGEAPRGYVAEIYYLELSPHVTGMLLSENGRRGSEAHAKARQIAARNLAAILAEFQSARGCGVLVDGQPFDPEVPLSPAHRWRVEIDTQTDGDRGQAR